MSGFCVFGSSLPIARARCEKKVPLLDEATKNLLTEPEWRSRVEEAALAHFGRMAPVQISPAFDAPSFCEEWIRLADKSGLHSRFVVMCRGKKFDAKGNPKISKSSGLPMIGWVPYLTARSSL